LVMDIIGLIIIGFVFIAVYVWIRALIAWWEITR